MSPSRLRHLAATAAALVAGALVLPQAAAATHDHHRPVTCEAGGQSGSAAENPDNPDEITFHSRGPVRCWDPNENRMLTGDATATGTIAKGGCEGIFDDATYHAKTRWSDGTYTKATLHDFELLTGDHTGAVLISGTVSGHSTRFAGWHISIISKVAGDCGSDDGHKDLHGAVTYRP